MTPPDHEAAPAIRDRDREEHDLEAIVDLALESLVWHADTFADIRPAPSPASLRSAYGQLVNAPDSYFRVAALDAAVVGFLTASIQPATTSGIDALDEPTVYISDIIVTTAARRRGVARALLGDLDTWAALQGCRTIRLTMHAGNEAAQKLYAQLGYRPSWITFRKDRA